MSIFSDWFGRIDVQGRLHGRSYYGYFSVQVYQVSYHTCNGITFTRLSNHALYLN